MPDIRHSLLINAPAEAIYPLVSTGEGFSQWWSADVTEGAGGLVELGFLNRSTIYALKPVSAVTPLVANWLCTSGREWAGTRIEFKLERNGGKAQVRFTHADWADETDYFISCNTVWGGLMFRLRAAAEGKPQGPLFLANSLGY
ncbi:MAG TPA: SRPBCC domain-containing protein [Candidatus Acidoferrales bacterium]|nr:SRPBCC domain-containing protein [Candidatus Acidoferrales bacterium]